MDSLKTLIVFFFIYLERVKIHSIIKKHCEIVQNVSIFVEKLKIMQPPKMTFRIHLEPSIKSYECFMFLLNFGLEITLD